MFWLWIKAQIDDPFVPSWRNWTPFLGLSALGVWALAIDRTLPWRTVQYASLLLVGLGVWRALNGRRSDLVEKRRRLRLLLAVGAAAYIVVIEYVASETFGASGLATTIGLDLAIGAYLATAIALRVTREPVIAAAETPLRATHRMASADPEEARLLEALRHAMEVDKAFREESCGIAFLAARLGLPEYRLRRLINQRLGHRNFTTYVNGYRLAEATAALSDPGQARVPILTIALDTGFQSLGPFNRAFKAQTGLTPSEYRRAHLGDPEALLLPDGSPIRNRPAHSGNRRAFSRFRREHPADPDQGCRVAAPNADDLLHPLLGVIAESVPRRTPMLMRSVGAHVWR
jgi:AraC-like DNA-binding protein